MAYVKYEVVLDEKWDIRAKPDASPERIAELAMVRIVDWITDCAPLGWKIIKKNDDGTELMTYVMTPVNEDIYPGSDQALIQWKEIKRRG